MGMKNSKPGKTPTITTKNKQFNGLALIINHEKFDEKAHEKYYREVLKISDPEKFKIPPERRGSNLDVIELSKTLPTIGFQPRIYRDLKYSSLKSTIDCCSSETLDEVDCLLVIVMTHGDTGGELSSYDRPYFVEDIWKPFMQSQSLKGKPKIFLFQACRGGLMEEQVVESDGVSNPRAYPAVPVLNPEEPEFLFGFSTPEEHFSYRYPEKGSLYITALCDEIGKISSSKDLFSLLTKVTHETAIRGDPVHGCFQTPCYVSFLHNNLCLQKVSTLKSTTASKGQSEVSQQQQKDRQNRGIKRKLEADNMVNQLQYTWPNEGHALIFHTTYHKTEALTLHTNLKKNNFNANMFDLKEDFENHIKKELEKMPESAGCVMVFVLAELTVGNNETGKLEHCFAVDQKIIPVITMWKQFFPSSCKKFLQQPKLFFFLDPQNRMEIDRKIGQQETTPSIVSEPCTVTENADFLFTFGYGKSYYNLLKNAIKEGGDVISSITSVMNRANKQQKPKEGKMSHFQTALRFPLTFKRPDLPMLESVEIQNLTENSTPLPKKKKENERESPVASTSTNGIQNFVETESAEPHALKKNAIDELTTNGNVNVEPSSSNVTVKEKKLNEKKTPKTTTPKKPRASRGAHKLTEQITFKEVKIGKKYQLEKLEWNNNAAHGPVLGAYIRFNRKQRYYYLPKSFTKVKYPENDLNKYSEKPYKYIFYIKNAIKLKNGNVSTICEIELDEKYK